VAAGKVHEYQDHALQEGFIYGPDNRSYLAMGNTLLLPNRGGFQDALLQRVHHASQGTGRTAHLGLQVKTAEKLADRFGSNPTLETEHKESGHDEADEPGSAFWRFPQPRLGVAVSACHRLRVAMHAAFGKPGVTSQLSHAQLTIF